MWPGPPRFTIDSVCPATHNIAIHVPQPEDLPVRTVTSGNNYPPNSAVKTTRLHTVHTEKLGSEYLYMCTTYFSLQLGGKPLDMAQSAIPFPPPTHSCTPLPTHTLPLTHSHPSPYTPLPTHALTPLPPRVQCTDGGLSESPSSLPLPPYPPAPLLLQEVSPATACVEVVKGICQPFHQPSYSVMSQQELVACGYPSLKADIGRST